MNREEIIRMALKAGMSHFSYFVTTAHVEDLERFGALVAAHEREACAKVVEDYCGAWDDEGYALAAAIRARGQK
jgi:hypothetical protein